MKADKFLYYSYEIRGLIKCKLWVGKIQLIVMFAFHQRILKNMSKQNELFKRIKPKLTFICLFFQIKDLNSLRYLDEIAWIMILACFIIFVNSCDGCNSE
ncbi:hypothetical protein BpHYR1_003137 [Brachionus plicatilis]|uniref:Uncharacterized protein n=1 Tax=Brachionus plicatilis TaxID=10195 RepID=A0A3M7QAZ3_BRAPC|nr:hypothetical protein BpHYR1_003137 [Brachionus plicatilis]